MNLYKKSTGKIILPLAIALITGLAGGVLISNYTTLGQRLVSQTGSDQSAEKEILYWVAPMDPGFRRDEPGKSPMGMDLVPVYAEEKKEPEILYWVAPMDPAFRRDAPGKSPMGMDLVPVYADEVDAQPGVVKIDPTTVNNMGVRTAHVERGNLSRRIDTVGYVGFDEDTLRRAVSVLESLSC